MDIACGGFKSKSLRHVIDNKRHANFKGLLAEPHTSHASKVDLQNGTAQALKDSECGLSDLQSSCCAILRVQLQMPEACWGLQYK